MDFEPLSYDIRESHTVLRKPLRYSYIFLKKFIIIGCPLEGNGIAQFKDKLIVSVTPTSPICQSATRIKTPSYLLGWLEKTALVCCIFVFCDNCGKEFRLVNMLRSINSYLMSGRTWTQLKIVTISFHRTDKLWELLLIQYMHNHSTSLFELKAISEDMTAFSDVTRRNKRDKKLFALITLRGMHIHSISSRILRDDRMHIFGHYSRWPNVLSSRTAILADKSGTNLPTPEGCRVCWVGSVGSNRGRSLCYNAPLTTTPQVLILEEIA